MPLFLYGKLIKSGNCKRLMQKYLFNAVYFFFNHISVMFTDITIYRFYHHNCRKSLINYNQKLLNLKR